MFIIYDEYELLELFEAEPLVIATKEAGMFIYSKKFSTGIKISLYLSVYERECEISMCINENGFYETSLCNVEYLRQEGKRLRIHQNDSETDYLISFYPSFFMKTEENGTSFQ